MYTKGQGMANVRLDGRMHAGLLRLGKERGLSIQEMVGQAVAAYIHGSTPAVATPSPQAPKGQGRNDPGVEALRQQLASEHKGYVDGS